MSFNYRAIKNVADNTWFINRTEAGHITGDTIYDDLSEDAAKVIADILNDHAKYETK